MIIIIETVTLSIATHNSRIKIIVTRLVTIIDGQYRNTLQIETNLTLTDFQNRQSARDD